ncbi:hypothetical protein SKAU_G00096180 [Synaphobranchus kaupii]|uniref:Uncharacterized protein n=1 Tax=Synaphobranchus kaupii TaxID=118154 RepID=A0A9Q1FXN5_SYNKA|nr:hypothetical protein SKAU_G00096180 [Synaphobranchus kaupii]
MVRFKQDPLSIGGYAHPPGAVAIGPDWGSSGIQGASSSGGVSLARFLIHLHILDQILQLPGLMVLLWFSTLFWLRFLQLCWL